MNKAALLIYMLTILGLASNAKATQSECDSVLIANLADDTTIVDKTSAKSSASYAACSMSYKEFNKTLGAGAEASWYSFSGSANYNQQNYEKWQDAHCDNNNQNANRDAFRYLANKTFKSTSGVVEAWSTCMANVDGLDCWATPSSSKKNIEVKVKWKSNVPSLPIVRKSPLTGGSVLGGGPTNELVPRNSKILKGIDTVLIERDPSSEVTGIISAELQRTVAYSCSIYVPPACKLEAGDADFDGDKCADTYEIQNGKMMVKLSKNDRYIQVPDNIPTYDATLGFWLTGDFNGDGITDLLHMVTKDASGNKLDYNHVHFSDGKGGFKRPTKFDFRCAANPQCDYNASLGYWTARNIDKDVKTDLEHDPQLPDGRKHCWLSNGDGDFVIKILTNFKECP